MSFGSGPSLSDLPAAPAAQPGGGLLAGQPEAGGNPQHIGLLAGFAELAQLGTRAVHLIAAHEVQPHTFGEGYQVAVAVFAEQLTAVPLH